MNDPLSKGARIQIMNLNFCDEADMFHVLISISIQGPMCSFLSSRLLHLCGLLKSRENTGDSPL